MKYIFSTFDAAFHKPLGLGYGIFNSDPERIVFRLLSAISRKLQILLLNSSTLSLLRVKGSTCAISGHCMNRPCLG